MKRQDASSNVSGGKPRLNSPDRSQIDPSPKRIDDLIGPDHPARVVWALVQDLDFTPLYDGIKAVEHHAGRAATDPCLLVALWLYATKEGIGSARAIAGRCQDCDPFKWLCGGVNVNYHTISDFRTDHPEWLQQQVVHNIAAMRAEGLVDLQQLGQDGMRVRASAGNDSFKSAERLEELLAEAQQTWDTLQAEFEQDLDLSARERAAQERAARERMERLKQAQEEVRKIAEQRAARHKQGEAPTARASTTDPESRRMKMGDGGIRPAYNVEFSSDLQSLVIVAADVVNAGNDAGQMEPMVQKIEAEQAPLPAGAEYYVDGGFATLEDVESVGRRNVTVYSPVREVAKQQQRGQDPYVAKPGDTPQVAAWRKRMGTAEAQQKYKQRSKTEWANAECRKRGLQQFLVRGLEKVKSVVLWFVLTHNLLRMVALRAPLIQTTA